MNLEKAVELAKANNSEAIAYLYEATYKNAYYVALKYMQNEHDAYDVVQDSYIKAFKDIDQLSDPEKFSSWLSTIVAHKALDAKKKKVPTFFSETEDEESGTDISDTFEDDRVDISPEMAIDQKETSRLINEMISDLTDEQRFCITMFYMEDMSVKEIAQILGVSENTVKSRLNYGRTKIKDKVLELEKKGTKLYGLLPFVFFIALFKSEAQACEVTVPSVERILSATGANSASAGVATGKTAAESATKAGLKVFGKTVSLKVAGIVAAAVVGVGAVGAATMLSNMNASDEQYIYTDFDKDGKYIAMGLMEVEKDGTEYLSLGNSEPLDNYEWSSWQTIAPYYEITPFYAKMYDGIIYYTCPVTHYFDNPDVVEYYVWSFDSETGERCFGRYDYNNISYLKDVVEHESINDDESTLYNNPKANVIALNLYEAGFDYSKWIDLTTLGTKGMSQQEAFKYSVEHQDEWLELISSTNEHLPEVEANYEYTWNNEYNSMIDEPIDNSESTTEDSTSNLEIEDSNGNDVNTDSSIIGDYSVEAYEEIGITLDITFETDNSGTYFYGDTFGTFSKQSDGTYQFVTTGYSDGTVPEEPLISVVSLSVDGDVLTYTELDTGWSCKLKKTR